ncbi:DNA polymerase III subunit theta [Proteus faecis]|nr:DNA polymerase III subunit theta [Proteus faecis]MCT8249492.1 DNA polymerase III subunit theta [Proteus faecis]
MKNLAELTLDEKDKTNVDLTANGVAYKERLAFYRERSKQ